MDEALSEKSTESSPAKSIIGNVLSEDYDLNLIKRVPLDLRPVGERKDKLAFLLYNVLSEEECEALIQISERKGYVPALLNVGGGREILCTDIRNNHRVVIDDDKFVASLWARIASFLPQSFGGLQVVGPNERLRFLRYDPGERFTGHRDGAYERPDGSESSLITLQIYLKEGFVGGETTFLPVSLRTKRTVNTSLPIVPKTGLILVFEHQLYHEGSTLVEGRKYTIRTDVMFTHYLTD